MLIKSFLYNRQFQNFCEYALKSSENQRFSSPKFFPSEKTFLNANIHQNFPFALQSRVQSSHNHSQQISKDVVFSSRKLIDNHAYKKFEIPADNSIKMLPLTLQSEIRTSDNTLIKGNC